jgi:sulfhydrogenase subunit delta
MIKVGWFSFTCCEGCSMIFLEILNDKFFEWKKKIEFKSFRMLKKEDIEGPFDISIVEGAISTRKDIEKLKKIRANSHKLIIVGSCAIDGYPAGLRNKFDEERKKEIKPILDEFGHLDKVLKIEEIVDVDGKVNGCPMQVEEFLKVFEENLKLLGE